jgi:hypothetical protein
VSDQEIADLCKRIAEREGMHVGDWMRMHETNQQLASRTLTKGPSDGFVRPARTRVFFRVMKRAALLAALEEDEGCGWHSDCLTAPEGGDVIVRRSKGERTWYVVLHREHDVDADHLNCTVERTAPPP